MGKVWVTGDAVVDLIPDGEHHYLKCPGGAPANVAVAISRLGGNAAFFGRVGNDPFGKFMHQTLNKEQVDCQYLVLDDQQRTSTVVVDLDDQGERSFTFMVKPSADQFFQPQDIPDFSAGDWLHVCSIALANEPSRSSTFDAIERIKKAGGYFSFDPNLREEVWQQPQQLIEVVMKAAAHADVAKFSEEELTYLTQTDSIESGIAALEALNIPLVIITQGAKGALVITPESQQLISGKVVKVICCCLQIFTDFRYDKYRQKNFCQFSSMAGLSTVKPRLCVPFVVCRVVVLVWPCVEWYQSCCPCSRVIVILLQFLL